MSIKTGSEWRKWDLHVHTKDTNKNDQFKSKDFDAFCIDFFKKAIQNNISAIGITDYFCIENYKKIKKYVSKIDEKIDFTDNEKEFIKNIFLLPNVELRMLPTTGKKRLINIHCLFNPQYIESLDNDFFTSIEHSTGSGKKYKMNRQGMIELGKDLEPSLDEGEAYKRGINSFVVTVSDLQKLLDENRKFRENTIVVVSNSNNDGASGLQKHYDMFENEKGSLDGVRKAIYSLSDLIFSSNKKDINYFLGKKINEEEVLKQCGSLKACIHGCDAHTEDKLFVPDKKRYCWIKADTTFEGLKQIIFEPESRVCIQENKPLSSIHNLEQVSLSFDESTKWGDDKFCFSGVKYEIVFSPNLTCIIGGRGSGKSTLLNLIAEKIGKQENNFFNTLSDNNPSQFIKFTPDIVGNIEFLAQNTIEKFATDSSTFTDAIYTRIDKMSGNNLITLEKEVVDGLSSFEEQIDLQNFRCILHNELIDLKKQFKMYDSIIKTFTDKKYIDTKSELDMLQKNKSVIETSRSRYEKLYREVNALKKNNQLIKDVKNDYDTYHNELYRDIKSIFEKYQNKNYEKDKKISKDLEDTMEEKRKSIESYLKDKGLSDDNIQDAQLASKNIDNVRATIKDKIKKLTEIKYKMRTFDTNHIDELKNNFDEAIEKELSKINIIFKDIADRNSLEVKLIEVKYEFDKEVFDKIFQKLEDRLNIRNEISSFRRTLIIYISEVNLDSVLEIKNGKKFVEKIDFRPTQAYSAIKEIFSIDANFQIYKLLIQKEFRNIKDNKVLKVYYDNKSLDNSSFGQKCTAAIVILLSLGNNPIIIDEPEAHLDSSLIANYLVELIKQKKKQRQIIFATHNANFVLNADAELIIKLENNDGSTSIKSFTIEDIDNRDDLLKLEGGKEAFKKRERKYNLSNG